MSGEGKVSVALCDRGTIDGVAYWPDNGSSFWTAMGTDPDRELDLSPSEGAVGCRRGQR